jgi:hypothetical protein
MNVVSKKYFGDFKRFFNDFLDSLGQKQQLGEWRYPKNEPRTKIMGKYQWSKKAKARVFPC